MYANLWEIKLAPRSMQCRGVQLGLVGKLICKKVVKSGGKSARAIEMTLFVLASALSIIIHLMRSLCAFLFI